MFMQENLTEIEIAALVKQGYALVSNEGDPATERTRQTFDELTAPVAAAPAPEPAPAAADPAPEPAVAAAPAPDAPAGK
jgi:hypothetical protein